MFSVRLLLGIAVSADALSRTLPLQMKYSVAVVGGGPSGSCAAEVFARDKTIKSYLIERKVPI